MHDGNDENTYVIHFVNDHVTEAMEAQCPRSISDFGESQRHSGNARQRFRNFASELFAETATARPKVGLRLSLVFEGTRVKPD